MKNPNEIVQEAHVLAIQKADAVVPEWSYGTYEHQHWLHVYEDMYTFIHAKLREGVAQPSTDMLYALI